MKTTIQAIEQLRLGNNRDVLILGLGISYLEAMRFDRAGVLLRLSSEGMTREVLGSLAFMAPLDAPAWVTVDVSAAGTVREGDAVELLAPVKR